MQKGRNMGRPPLNQSDPLVRAAIEIPLSQKRWLDERKAATGLGIANQIRNLIEREMEASLTE